jgi:hypothetical protein
MILFMVMDSEFIQLFYGHRTPLDKSALLALLRQQCEVGAQ